MAIAIHCGFRELRTRPDHGEQLPGLFNNWVFEFIRNPHFEFGILRHKYSTWALPSLNKKTLSTLFITYPSQAVESLF